MHRQLDRGSFTTCYQDDAGPWAPADGGMDRGGRFGPAFLWKFRVQGSFARAEGSRASAYLMWELLAGSR